MYLTEYELQMMHVIWRANAPITSSEVLKRSVDKGWKDNSLHPMLQRLIKKGYIREADIIREGRALARTFLPVISCEQYYAEFLADAAKDAGVPTLFSAIVHSPEVKKQDLAQIQDELDQIKRGLDKDD